MQLRENLEKGTKPAVAELTGDFFPCPTKDITLMKRIMKAASNC